jgi:magnesium-transporting ATPase (P-type)
MLVLCEGVDPNLSRALSNLRRSGVNVISFSCCVVRQRVPEIPAALRNGGRAYAGEFLKRGLSITYGFGAYDEYCGFDEVRIAELARYVKSQNKTLAIMGFSDYAKEAIECADVFISCAPIRTESGGRMSEEIRSLEIPGEMSSAACTQEVKSMADILLMRPVDRKGGLEPLARVIEYGRIAYRNLRNYTYYLVIAQMMRIISVALPMLFGYSTADVRQMLYLGFVFDLFVLLIFMSDSRRSSEDRRRIRKDVGTFDILAVLKANGKLTVCAAVGAGATVILPRIAALLEIFGKYFYRAEFTYISLVLLQALVFICIYAKDLQNRSALLKLINNRLAQICAGVTVLFTALCFFTPIGRFFGIIESQLFYFFLAFLPAAAFFVCYLVLGSREKTKKGVKRTGKL